MLLFFVSFIIFLLLQLHLSLCSRISNLFSWFPFIIIIRRRAAVAAAADVAFLLLSGVIFGVGFFVFYAIPKIRIRSVSTTTEWKYRMCVHVCISLSIICHRSVCVFLLL